MKPISWNSDQNSWSNIQIGINFEKFVKSRKLKVQAESWTNFQQKSPKPKVKSCSHASQKPKAKVLFSRSQAKSQKLKLYRSAFKPCSNPHLWVSPQIDVKRTFYWKCRLGNDLTHTSCSWRFVLQFDLKNKSSKPLALFLIQPFQQAWSKSNGLSYIFLLRVIFSLHFRSSFNISQNQNLTSCFRFLRTQHPSYATGYKICKNLGIVTKMHLW